MSDDDFEQEHPPVYTVNPIWRATGKVSIEENFRHLGRPTTGRSAYNLNSRLRATDGQQRFLRAALAAAKTPGTKPLDVYVTVSDTAIMIDLVSPQTDGTWSIDDVQASARLEFAKMPMDIFKAYMQTREEIRRGARYKTYGSNEERDLNDVRTELHDQLLSSLAAQIPPNFLVGRPLYMLHAIKLPFDLWYHFRPRGIEVFSTAKLDAPSNG